MLQDRQKGKWTSSIHKPSKSRSTESQGQLEVKVIWNSRGQGNLEIKGSMSFKIAEVKLIWNSRSVESLKYVIQTLRKNSKKP